MNSFSFYGLPKYGNNYKVVLATSSPPLFHLHCYKQVDSISTFNLFKLFCLTSLFEMPSLNRNDKGTMENCGTPITRINLARHKKRFSVRLLYCSKCPTFSRKSPENLIYHIAKKHSASKPHVVFKCKICCEDFPVSYALRQHKTTQYAFVIETANVDPDDIVNKTDDIILRRELRSCQPPLLVCELERVRDNVFNYAVDNLNEIVVNDKLDIFSTIQNVLRKRIGLLGSYWRIYEMENSNVFTHKKISCGTD